MFGRLQTGRTRGRYASICFCSDFHRKPHHPPAIHLPLPSAMDTVCDEPQVPKQSSGIANPLPAWKRAADVACSIAALPVLGWCTLVMALVTKLVSPGPVFFRQERSGYRGRRFKIYKFRTMMVNADPTVHQKHLTELMGSNAPMMKLDGGADRRLIPGGWILRASGLDELPQIINVLRGEMSLIGPRPCVPYEYEQYQPWQRARFDAMPGLTGLWQVSGKNRTTFGEMVRLDIRYARHFSFWLDVKIILLTVPALVGQFLETRHRRKAGWQGTRDTTAPFPALAKSSPPPAYPLSRDHRRGLDALPAPVGWPE
jgi:lipopolysaccharide/colanic/teichoic acid biosynthesis glycosyltransferase